MNVGREDDRRREDIKESQGKIQQNKLYTGMKIVRPALQCHIRNNNFTLETVLSAPLKIICGIKTFTVKCEHACSPSTEEVEDGGREIQNITVVLQKLPRAVLPVIFLTFYSLNLPYLAQQIFVLSPTSVLDLQF